MAPHPTSNISFWNSRGLENKKIQLEDFLHSSDIDIMAISEIKCNFTTNQVYKNFKLLHLSNLGGAVGIAILSKRNLQYVETKINTNSPSPKVLACIYTINNKTLIVILIYSAPNKSLTCETLAEIFSQATAPNPKNKIIIFGIGGF
jgi:exonuclease III